MIGEVQLVDERRYREVVAVQRVGRLNLAHTVGEKHAVGRVQIARHGVELMRGQPDRCRQLEHHPARDAGEAAALQWGRDDFAVVNPKQIADISIYDIFPDVWKDLINDRIKKDKLKYELKPEAIQ